MGRTRTALQHLAWLDGGRKLVAITQLHSFVTFDVPSGTILHATSAPETSGRRSGGIPFLAVHPGGLRLATAKYYDPRVHAPTPAHLWTLTDSALTPAARPPEADLHGGLAFTPDGTALVGGAACRSVPPKQFVGEIVWWDLARAKAGKGFTGHAGLAGALAFTADAHLVSCGGDDYVRVWDVAARREVGNRKVRHHGGSLAVAPDGRGLAFIHDYHGGFTLLDPLANKKLGKPREVKAHDGRVADVAYSPTNERHRVGGERPPAVPLDAHRGIGPRVRDSQLADVRLLRPGRSDRRGRRRAGPHLRLRRGLTRGGTAQHLQHAARPSAFIVATFRSGMPAVASGSRFTSDTLSSRSRCSIGYGERFV